MDIVNVLGKAAVLEQMGEECCELGQAAMKLARKYRGENPTPKTEEECVYALVEELADVMICMDLLFTSGLISHEAVESFYLSKEKRWHDRINEHLAEKEKADKDVMAVYMKGE